MLTKAQSHEHSKRRRHLMELLGSDAIAIIPAATEKQRNRDVQYRYRQDSDFYYLTGFQEPDAVAVLIPEREQGEYLLFCREKDERQEVVDGPRLGVEQAPLALQANDAFPITDIDDILPGLLEGRERVYYSMGKNAEFDSQVMRWVNSVRGRLSSGQHAPSVFISLDYHLHEMRLYKSQSEIKALRKSAALSAKAHLRAMARCQPGLKEYQLEAELTYTYLDQGARHAFPPIVASGANGCILHYVENTARLRKGDLVLVDSGAERDYYAGDISRTYPVSGRFTKSQRLLYEIVLEAQLAAIAIIKPGNHWDQPHLAAMRVITKGLLDLGILEGPLDALMATEAYRPFCMYRTGHWLGMDVHDVGEYKTDNEWRMLESGMVMTVEPGLYMPNTPDIPKRFRQIGIRIEDNVLVTKKGCEVLSDGVPKQVEEIEAWMAQHHP